MAADHTGAAPPMDDGDAGNRPSSGRIGVEGPPPGDPPVAGTVGSPGPPLEVAAGVVGVTGLDVDVGVG